LPDGEAIGLRADIAVAGRRGIARRRALSQVAFTNTPRRRGAAAGSTELADLVAPASNP
jgi:hypothetical protein